MVPIFSRPLVRRDRPEAESVPRLNRPSDPPAWHPPSLLSRRMGPDRRGMVGTMTNMVLRAENLSRGIAGSSAREPFWPIGALGGACRWKAIRTRDSVNFHD